jgi:predicted ATPase/DNA-binding winged helix-turn-helix (wHTH) protein
MFEPAVKSRDVVSFGPFNLDVSRRLLMKDDAPMVLGARTLDTLIALVSRPNQAVSKRDLMAEVWPDVIVEEGSLRFHIAALRKALGDGRNGARYIATLAGRGYCFVAPISRLGGSGDALTAAAASFSHANLPSRLTRMVGRDDDVSRLSTQLTAARFVTVVGAGGVGKTTVAVAAGHHLMEGFAGAVLFIDLGMLTDPDLVATAVASLLGLSVRSDDATPNLIAYLRDKRILLILDTCEHLIETVAALASQIFKAAPKVHILATSREPLQAEDEHVYRLDPLACPPDDPGLTAAVVGTFPAIQLFLERAEASGARLDFGDAEAPIVVTICRKLDGVALAIELAARRVESYGLQQTAALLDQRLKLAWLGPRTAPPRQRTLQATLDWSYRLLSERERVVLRRLAVFVGHFTLDAALEVVTSSTLDQSLFLGAMDSLVAKSMVATRPAGAMMRYRLLDTTRAYVLEFSDAGPELVEGGLVEGELADVAVRHADYYCRWLEQIGTDWSTLSTGVDLSSQFAGLNNVRAALEWCFGPNGNTRIGVGLAAAAAPVFLARSLLPESHRWSERAIRALDDTARGGSEEMHLQAGLGASSMYMHGQSEAARAALSRSLAIAEARSDVLHQVGLLGVLSMFHTRDGDFKTALDYARRSRTVALAVTRTVEESAGVALAQSTLGRSLHFVGDHSAARVELEASFQHWSRSQETSEIYLGLDHHILVGIGLARTLWLQGYPAQAEERVRQTIKQAERKGNPATLGLALAWAPGIFLWIGDLCAAEEHADRLIAHAESHSLGPYLAVGRSYKAAIAVRRGDAKGGVEGLQSSLQQLHALRFEMHTDFRFSLVEGLVAIGRSGEGMTLIEETIGSIEVKGDLLHMPEALRIKARVLLSMPQRDDAKMCLVQSLDWSRRQGARSWELRTAVDLAALLSRSGRLKEARALLQPVFEQFVEGGETADVKAAERLLVTLR